MARGYARQRTLSFGILLKGRMSLKNPMLWENTLRYIIRPRSVGPSPGPRSLFLQESYAWHRLAKYCAYIID